MRGTLGLFATVQAVVVTGASALSWLAFGIATAKALCVGGTCAWLGSMAYLVIQSRQPAGAPWAALRAHLVGQVVKWIVAAASLFVAMRQGPPETAAPLVIGFVLALLVHALALPLIKIR
jgi:F0F1-type ATP synthase assembly protein I